MNKIHLDLKNIQGKFAELADITVKKNLSSSFNKYFAIKYVIFTETPWVEQKLLMVKNDLYCCERNRDESATRRIKEHTCLNKQRIKNILANDKVNITQIFEKNIFFFKYYQSQRYTDIQLSPRYFLKKKYSAKNDPYNTFRKSNGILSQNHLLKNNPSLIIQPLIRCYSCNEKDVNPTIDNYKKKKKKKALSNQVSRNSQQLKRPKSIFGWLCSLINCGKNGCKSKEFKCGTDRCTESSKCTETKKNPSQREEKHDKYNITEIKPILTEGLQIKSSKSTDSEKEICLRKANDKQKCIRKETNKKKNLTHNNMSDLCKKYDLEDEWIAENKKSLSCPVVRHGIMNGNNRPVVTTSSLSDAAKKLDAKESTKEVPLICPTVSHGINKKGTEGTKMSDDEVQLKDTTASAAVGHGIMDKDSDSTKKFTAYVEEIQTTENEKNACPKVDHGLINNPTNIKKKIKAYYNQVEKSDDCPAVRHGIKTESDNSKFNSETSLSENTKEIENSSMKKFVNIYETHHTPKSERKSHISYEFRSEMIDEQIQLICNAGKTAAESSPVNNETAESSSLFEEPVKSGSVYYQPGEPSSSLYYGPAKSSSVHSEPTATSVVFTKPAISSSAISESLDVQSQIVANPSKSDNHSLHLNVADLSENPTKNIDSGDKKSTNETIKLREVPSSNRRPISKSAESVIPMYNVSKEQELAQSHSDTIIFPTVKNLTSKSLNESPSTFNSSKTKYKAAIFEIKTSSKSSYAIVKKHSMISSDIKTNPKELCLSTNLHNDSTDASNPLYQRSAENYKYKTDNKISSNEENDSQKIFNVNIAGTISRIASKSDITTEENKGKDIHNKEYQLRLTLTESGDKLKTSSIYSLKNPSHDDTKYIIQDDKIMIDKKLRPLTVRYPLEVVKKESKMKTKNLNNESDRPVKGECPLEVVKKECDMKSKSEITEADRSVTVKYPSEVVKKESTMKIKNLITNDDHKKPANEEYPAVPQSLKTTEKVVENEYTIINEAGVLKGCDSAKIAEIVQSKTINNNKVFKKPAQDKRNTFKDLKRTQNENKKIVYFQVPVNKSIPYAKDKKNFCWFNSSLIDNNDNNNDINENKSNSIITSNDKIKNQLQKSKSSLFHKTEKSSICNDQNENVVTNKKFSKLYKSKSIIGLMKRKPVKNKPIISLTKKNYNYTDHNNTRTVKALLKALQKRDSMKDKNYKRIKPNNSTNDLQNIITNKESTNKKNFTDIRKDVSSDESNRQKQEDLFNLSNNNELQKLNLMTNKTKEFCQVMLELVKLFSVDKVTAEVCKFDKSFENLETKKLKINELQHTADDLQKSLFKFLSISQSNNLSTTMTKQNDEVFTGSPKLYSVKDISNEMTTSSSTSGINFDVKNMEKLKEKTDIEMKELNLIIEKEDEFRKTLFELVFMLTNFELYKKKLENKSIKRKH